MGYDAAEMKFQQIALVSRIWTPDRISIGTDETELSSNASVESVLCSSRFCLLFLCSRTGEPGRPNWDNHVSGLP